MKKNFLLFLFPVGLALDWGIVNPLGFGMPLSLSAASAIALLAAHGFAPRLALTGVLAGIFETLSVLRPGAYTVIFLCWMIIEEASRRLLSLKGLPPIRGLGLGVRLAAFILVANALVRITSFF